MTKTIKPNTPTAEFWNGVDPEIAEFERGLLESIAQMKRGEVGHTHTQIDCWLQDPWPTGGQRQGRSQASRNSTATAPRCWPASGHQAKAGRRA
jgi:hypothetical protein